MPGGTHPPLSVIQSWIPKINYQNPPLRPEVILPLAITLTVIALTVVALRFWSRLYLTRNFGIDDWLLFFGMFPTVGLVVATCLAIEEGGFNRHVWDVPLQQLPVSRKYAFAIQFLYLWSTTLIKTSILLFYKRLTTGLTGRRFFYMIYAGVAFVLVYFVAFTFVLIFICSPVKAYWLANDLQWAQTHHFHCNDEGASLTAAGVVSVLQDFLVAVMPIALVARMDIPWRQKFAIAGIFTIGFFLCVCGILRLVYIHQIFFTTYDVTWASWSVWIWTLVEVVGGTIVASAPALKVLFKSILGGSRYDYYYSEGSRQRSEKGSRFSIPLPNRLSGRHSHPPLAGEDAPASPHASASGDGQTPDGFVRVTVQKNDDGTELTALKGYGGTPAQSRPQLNSGRPSSDAGTFWSSAQNTERDIVTPKKPPSERHDNIV